MKDISKMLEGDLEGLNKALKNTAAPLNDTKLVDEIQKALPRVRKDGAV